MVGDEARRVDLGDPQRACEGNELEQRRATRGMEGSEMKGIWRGWQTKRQGPDHYGLV